MCLGIPGQIIDVNGTEAVIEFWGTRRPVRLDSISQTVSPGDYVIDHAGFAVRRIPMDEVEGTLAMYEMILAEGGEDPIAQEIACELAAAQRELLDI